MLVHTKQGKIQGVKEGNILVFRGIRYAEPPIGQLRFCPPKPVKSWEDTLIAQDFGPRALQPTDSDTSNENVSYSEDCLNLNIWTPAIDGKKREVIFWIHGGGFVTGSGSNPKTSGRVFAERDDIVFVSINYRLGAFGFLHLGDLLGDRYKTSGNCGILDIIAALRWVKENIAYFGGDPDCVTVMGQSAGAKCIGALLVAPEAKGLFHRAILQSGAFQSIRDKNTAQQITDSLLQELSLKKEEAYKLLELPAEVILEAEKKLVASVRGSYIFGPVVDGLTIPHSPEKMIEQKAVNAVPVLIGTNKAEAKSFSFCSLETGISKEYIINTLFGKNGPIVMKVYHAACMKKSEEEAWQEILTDYLYGIAAIHLAEMLSDLGIPVWLYRFDFGGTSDAVHGRELAFVWNDASTREIPKNGEDLASKVHEAWVSFARTGQPQTTQLPKWMPYNSKEPTRMLFDTECKIQHLDDYCRDRDFPAQMLIL